MKPARASAKRSAKNAAKQPAKKPGKISAPASAPLPALVIKAVANERRLEILNWLREPLAHFPPQVAGDLVKHGVCGASIAEKLGVSAPTASEHLRILTHAGLVSGRRIKQWTFYQRNEKRIAEVKKAFARAW